MSERPLSPLCALVFWFTVSLAPQLTAQEAPLSTGQFDSVFGLRLQRPAEIFGADGSAQSLDDALSLSNATLRALSLETRISYALNPRVVLSLGGAALRSATLTGESSLLPDITLSRREQVVGPGDLSLSLSFMPRPTPWAQWGVSASVRAPLGSDTSRLPLGSGVFGAQVGLFGYQTQEPYFVRASLLLGNGGSLVPELLASVGGGLWWRRYMVEQELRGLAPLSGVPDIAVEAREVLTGVASLSTSLSSVSTLSASFGNLRPLVSVQWLFAGQNEAKGLAYFVGLRVAPPRRGDHSSRSVP